ncbi:hypothetical protein BO71DRAFT_400797 [Aspergillus ellipticus CBS 707.79]|uniref:Uncharacterized protein n=1 Tax=Aspergillus ellipticus CBS 707.79 TaxID=1448320 RepID=A0A319D4S6_9EURO|nr:hypothetical protein BO71DRAFT_400797 [Aspergillus ellipticus CBS 707.79]
MVELSGKVRSEGLKGHGAVRDGEEGRGIEMGRNGGGMKAATILLVGPGQLLQSSIHSLQFPPWIHGPFPDTVHGYTSNPIAGEARLPANIPVESGLCSMEDNHNHNHNHTHTRPCIPSPARDISTPASSHPSSLGWGGPSFACLLDTVRASGCDRHLALFASPWPLT